MMIKDILHQKIISKKSIVMDWFKKKSSSIFFPFYSSFDLRDSGEKIVPVDANIFPAGFNNVCEVDLESIPAILEQYIEQTYGGIKKVILLTEEHEKNIYYWDNVSTLKKIMEQAHLEVIVCVPGRNIQEEKEVENSLGQKIQLNLLRSNLKGVDLVISNNDFSLDYDIPEEIPLNPSPLMGWKYRRKDQFFKEYNMLAVEFAHLIGVDPWHLTIKTELFEPFDPEDPSTLKNLKHRLELFLQDLRSYYKDQEPFAFLKNNSGTYGLGITWVQSPDEVDHWNYKTRKKMKASKGGRKVNKLILQEGIATALSDSQFCSEPVIYTIGAELVGGFLRTHSKKGVRENLNSPGAVYQKLCMSDLIVQVEGKDEENVYGWISRLALLSLAYEIKNRK
ncbi:MAG: glutamate--cysteine ligase [Bdellovibrionales bacterium]|nr:glutamate--cysteine ligase [Bdellovibrionales bacterium]